MWICTLSLCRVTWNTLGSCNVARSPSTPFSGFQYRRTVYCCMIPFLPMVVLVSYYVDRNHNCPRALLPRAASCRRWSAHLCKMSKTCRPGLFRCSDSTSRQNKSGYSGCYQENGKIPYSATYVRLISTTSHTTKHCRTPGGIPTLRKPILFEGRQVQVTINLAAALRALRLRDETRRMWIDALRIDQTDDVEKRSIR